MKILTCSLVAILVLGCFYVLFQTGEKIGAQQEDQFRDTAIAASQSPNKDNTNGVIALTLDGGLKGVIFVSVKGQIIPMLAEDCAADKTCTDLATDLAQHNKLFRVNMHSDCVAPQDDSKN